MPIGLNELSVNAFFKYIIKFTKKYPMKTRLFLINNR